MNHLLRESECHVCITPEPRVGSSARQTPIGPAASVTLQLWYFYYTKIVQMYGLVTNNT